MNNVDLYVFLKSLYAISLVPAAVLKNGHPVCRYPESGSVPGLYEGLPEKIKTAETYPAVFEEDGGFFGVLEYEEQFVVLGPCSAKSLPDISFNRFFNILAHAEYILNGKLIRQADFIAAKKDDGINSEFLDVKAQNVEHGTYYLEHMILDYVRQGDPSGLKAFLEEYTKMTVINEGKMAENELRHAKNITICLISQLAKQGAIPGGMDVEESYQLMDIYIRRCEKLKRLKDVYELRYSVMIDFAERIKKLSGPQDYSVDVSYAVQFIKNSSNKNIGIADVVAAGKKSRSCLLRKFREETGVTMGKYIMKCKLEDARIMLTYSNMTLAEISAYLNFSSQSYFQNTFKKEYGVTPAVYRVQSTAEPPA